MGHVGWDGTGDLFGVPLHPSVGSPSVHVVIHLGVEGVLAPLGGPGLLMLRSVLHHGTHVSLPVVPLGIGTPLDELSTHGVPRQVIGTLGVRHVPRVRGTRLWARVVVRWIRFEV